MTPSEAKPRKDITSVWKDQSLIDMPYNPDREKLLLSV